MASNNQFIFEPPRFCNRPFGSIEEMNEELDQAKDGMMSVLKTTTSGQSHSLKYRRKLARKYLFPFLGTKKWAKNKEE